jgi:NAD(P)-dependent dehydrogenase (short-subunit alcohol dehydrogenase family)
MPGLCEGRVAIVTGAGRGLGRAYALELARQGARVVVNDLADDAGSPADAVVAEIISAGGQAVASHDDVADWDAARRLVDQAIDAFGRLDVLVNNAGILRDRTLVSMSCGEWDLVIRVHLRGTAGPSHWAAAHWRALAKSGQPIDARIINTTSASGLYGSPSQSNYAAAKGGIAAFTVTVALELERYGITVNAVAPAARTRLTKALISDESAFPPERVASVVAWLASPESRDVTGRVFDVGGDWVSVAQGWRKGPTACQGGGWGTGQIGETLRDLLAKAVPNAAGDGTVTDLVGAPRREGAR